MVKKTHDLTIVVAPLKTVDMLIRQIPLVRDILNKGALIYPIKVTGTWENPEVKMLSVGAVGMEVWGIVTRTLKLPLKILEPLFTKDQEVGEKKTPPATIPPSPDIKHD